MIKTLLITGANNHDWKRSAPYVKSLLEHSGIFAVDLADNPAYLLSDAAKLAEYSLFVLDYNGPEWPEQAKRNFERSIQEGVGLVVIHASNNAFPDWAAYRAMIGLFWNHDSSGHGEFHAFEVNISEPRHPITEGLRDFRTMDEMYHRMGAAIDDYEVLATAYSDPKRGGTGNREPLLITLSYGKGRVFHTLLGHVWEGDPQGDYKGASMIALENEGFRQTLLRGCEWAAAGKVTLRL